MRATIKDVAREAGVSIGTVDRVLHNRAGVSEKTKKKVNQVVERLGYRPSKVAQALVSSGKTKKIGIVYPHVEVQFWDEVVRGIRDEEHRLEPFGVKLEVIATNTYKYEEQFNALKKLEDAGVDGIVAMAYHPTIFNERINELYDKGIPVATFVSDAPESKRIVYTGLDDFKCGEVAASLMELYLKGDGKIAIIGVHRGLQIVDDRVKGFVDRIRRSKENIRVVSILDAKDHMLDSYSEMKYVVNRMTKAIIRDNNDLKGIYVTNSFSGVAGSVVEELGLAGKIIIVGHESTKDNLDMLKKELVHGVVYMNQYIQVVNAIRSISDYIFNTNAGQEMNLVNIGIKIKENA